MRSLAHRSAKMADERPPLETEIRRLIAAAGPMPVAEYMRLCLTHPQYGYYVTRDPLGAAGDFITAPEVSQMFGELVGVWMAAVWRQMGAPADVRIIELGPGRGTMMADALRAARVVKDFYDAVVLHLIEVSPGLQELQRRRLQPFGLQIVWHTALADVPGGPSIIVANEFIDTLPVHQAVKRSDGWHQRVVGIGEQGKLTFGVGRDPLRLFESTLPPAVRQAPEGAIFEWRVDSTGLELGQRVRTGGTALIIDYGPSKSGLGDTLQAVANHAFVDPLAAPGQADLTAHVDFEALAHSAESIGARCHGPLPQRDLLFNLGIKERAARLTARAPDEAAAEVELALARLTEPGERGMGELFKALAIADRKLDRLPGFVALT
jgi:NADH dehydrogenase [ubiquinone] 1 alpha subcomplex assembly factor 7